MQVFLLQNTVFKTQIPNIYPSVRREAQFSNIKAQISPFGFCDLSFVIFWLIEPDYVLILAFFGTFVMVLTFGPKRCIIQGSLKN